jgi:putative transposase
MGSTTKQEVKSLSRQYQVSMNRTIKALGVAKSTVYYKPKAYPDRKRTPRRMLEEESKEVILAITAKKATYGVPRVKAILKRDYGIGLTKYMVHRFMKQGNLLIKRNRPRGANRPHTGKVAVKSSSTRWASDITSPFHGGSNAGTGRKSDLPIYWTVATAL